MDDSIVTQFSDTHKFLNALFGNIEKGNVYLWTLPEKRTWSFPVDDLKIMVSAARAMQDERDVYFGLGGSMNEVVSTERVKPNNVSFIPCLWMDIDIATPGAHVQTNLPKTVEEALSVLPDFLQPSITVSSGHGLHVYWLLKEAWVFDSQEENLRASNLMIRLQAYIKKLASERGWKLDSTADLSRVLRVPGTLNHKLGQKQPVRITQFNPEIRYNPSDLEHEIPDIDFRSEITNHGSFERRKTDASSDLMIANCQFLQHCLINASKITYGEWLSMLTNVVRGTDGIDKCHELSRGDSGRYTPKGTDFRLSEALRMNPHTCSYIHSTHGFSCPDNGCGVKSPCSFSLGKIDQARAKINMLGIPNVDKVFTSDMLTALSIVKSNDATLYAKTRDKLKGSGISLRDLDKAIKQHTQQITNSEVAEIQCSEVLGISEEQVQYLTKEGYAINAFGELCDIKYDQDKKPYYVKLANFLAWPVREISLDNGVERKTDFEIEGILSGSQKLRPVMVSSDDFSSMKWLVKEWGLSPNIYPGQSVKDKVRHAIQSLAKDIKRETVFTHTGWRKFDDKWVYLHAGGAIGDSSILVDLKKEGLSRYKLPEACEDIKSTVIESMQILKAAPLSVTFPLYGLSFLAPLCEPLRVAGIEPSFIIWLNGESGSLKSSLAALFLNYFGTFTGKTPPASFKDTTSAIEKRSFLTKDSILLVDDFHPTASAKEANAMEAIAQQLLRGYGDRVGRSRMKADTTLRATYIPRGLCIVTGESTPSAGQSTTARYMELSLAKGEINFDILDKLQANAKVLGQTMRSYIESIDIETLPDKLRSMHFELRARATISGQHKRIPEDVAWLHLGIGMGLTHAVSVGAITEQDKAYLLETGWNTLIELAEKQAALVNTEQPAKQFMSALSEMLSAKSVYTRFLSDGPTIGDPNFIGWHDADHYYLLPIITYNALTKYYSAHGGHFSVSATTLWRHLEQANAIVVQRDAKQTYRIVKKMIGGERMRVLQLRKQSLESS